jgi:hypothetical protein
MNFQNLLLSKIKSTQLIDLHNMNKMKKISTCRSAHTIYFNMEYTIVIHIHFPIID